MGYPNWLAGALGALAVALDPDSLAAIEQAVSKGPAAGSRAAQAHMRELDSQKG